MTIWNALMEVDNLIVVVKLLKEQKKKTEQKNY